MKRHLIAILLVVLICAFALSGSKSNLLRIHQREFKAVEQVGQIPLSFKEIVENDIFNGVTAFDGRLLKTETIATDDENRTVTNQVLMMDLYGKTLATYTCSFDDAYRVGTLTATKDGGFLFVLGFSDYAYDQNTWASDKGVASRIIKCDSNGNLQFDTPLDKVEGSALKYCFEKDGNFYFFGTTQTPETKTRGVYSPTDIYMVIITENGTILKDECIVGSDYDKLQYAEMLDDCFVLSISSQSGDNDFTDPDSKGYPRDWVFKVDNNLEITYKAKETGRDVFDYRIGEKNGIPVYLSDVKGLNAGSPEAFIDYGDFCLILSNNITGIYENSPPILSSIWYYRESVYSAYDYNGKLIFRASVDTSPDFDALAAKSS